jgi:hypothetical protein
MKERHFRAATLASCGADIVALMALCDAAMNPAAGYDRATLMRALVSKRKREKERDAAISVRRGLTARKRVIKTARKGAVDSPEIGLRES